MDESERPPQSLPHSFALAILFALVANPGTTASTLRSILELDAGYISPNQRGSPWLISGVVPAADNHAALAQPCRRIFLLF
jgi:hypothetical protein